MPCAFIRDNNAELRKATWRPPANCSSAAVEEELNAATLASIFEGVANYL